MFTFHFLLTLSSPQLKYQSELVMHSYQRTQPNSIQVSFSPFRLNSTESASPSTERFNDFSIISFSFFSPFNQLIKVYMRNLSIGSGNLAAGFALVLVPYLFYLVSRLDVDMLAVLRLFSCSSKINLWPLVCHYVRLQ